MEVMGLEDEKNAFLQLNQKYYTLAKRLKRKVSNLDQKCKILQVQNLNSWFAEVKPRVN